jgi:hypothetical protein
MGRPPAVYERFRLYEGHLLPGLASRAGTYQCQPGMDVTLISFQLRSI